MAFGITVKNQEAVIQIDSTYRNYVITEVGTSASGGPSYDFNGPLDRTNLIFIRPPIGYWMGTQRTYPGGSPDPTGIYPAGNYFYLSEDADQGTYPAPTDYLVAIRREAASIEGVGTYGLLAYNQSGGVPVYDSRLPNLSIAGVILAPASPIQTVTLDLPEPHPGKRYYFLLNTLVANRYSEGSGVYAYMARFVSNTRVEVYNNYFWGDSLGGGTFQLDADHQAVVLIAEY